MAVGSLAIVPPVPITRTFRFFPYTMLCWVCMLEPVCDGVSGAMGVDGRDMADGDAGWTAQTGKQG